MNKIAQFHQGTQSDLWKWVTVSTACVVCFVVGINATAILSAATQISSEFHIDEASFSYSYFLVTAWNLAAAIFPLFVLPFMEDVGIRIIYLIMYLLFIIFVMVQAVAPNFATLIVARVIAGACGGVLQNAVDGIAADLWQLDKRKRTTSLTLYTLSLLGGVTFGPVFGGAIIKFLNWRWILYIQLILYGALFPTVFLGLQETRPKEDRQKSETSENSQRQDSDMLSTILRSTNLLTTEFIVATFTLWSSFAFGCVFMCSQSVPQVFTALYGWSEWKTGLVQVSLLIGEIIGFGVCLVQDNLIYPHFTATKSNPEARLYTSIPATLLGLMGGFFLYAWSSYSEIPWIAPALGLVLIGLGITCVVQAVSVYVTDSYASHASSAISAVAFGENIFAALLPLATRDMYDRLEFPWASSLLAFASLALSFVPVMLVLSGAKIRGRSSYAESS
ncbi:multidrug transporter [Venturia nashicola]|uniref:Multidrug transporter n=1 Tax=Venturia nashicola TaxID=86259 RepID=A0A4Z1P658_9PEZI|nr:multidrug transporter [Venturia nashicola]